MANGHESFHGDMSRNEVELDLNKFKGEKEKRVENIMIEINNLITSWVDQNPGQWFWHHRRWKI